jgi:hypothetical protein
MASKKNKSDVDFELRATPVQHQADEASLRQTPSHEEIRGRAYDERVQPQPCETHADRAPGVARTSYKQCIGVK